jgi:hypothetical protein
LAVFFWGGTFGLTNCYLLQQLFININQYITNPHRNLKVGPANNFVNLSAKFVSPGSLATQMIPTAIASQALWYATKLCFFFSQGLSGQVTFFTTDSLSQSTSQGPPIFTPFILSLYRRPSTISIAIFI